MIREAAPEDCNIIFGVVFDDTIGDDLYVTLIATGIEPPDTDVDMPEIIDSRVKRLELKKKRPDPEETVAADTIPTATQTTYGKKAAAQPIRRRNTVSSLEDYQDTVPQQIESPIVYPSYDESLHVPQTPRRNVTQPRRMQQHTPGMDSFTYEDDDVPAFIRRQAN